MNRFLVILFLFSGFITVGAKAQDLIVTISGDSLNCTVMVQNLKSVNFFYKDGTKVITKELTRNSLTTVIIGFYTQQKKIPQTGVSQKQKIDDIKSPLNNVPITLESQPSMVESAPSLEALTLEPIKENDNPSTSMVKSDSIELNIVPGSSDLFAPLLDSASFFATSRWYFGFRGGYENRLFRTGNKFPPAYAKYLKELKSGYAFGVGIGYFFWKQVALGMNAELYKSIATMPDDSRDDAISIKYIGPSMVYRNVSVSQKSAVYTGFSVGYQTYSNQVNEAGNLLGTYGKSLGWGINVGVDYKISPRAAISFTASCIMGTIYKITRESGGKKDTIQLSRKDFEELSRIALTVGLKFF